MHHAHPHTPVWHLSRLQMLVTATLVIVAALVAVLVFSSGDSGSSPVRASTPSSQVGGPNEALRGQAAAGAAGATRPSPGGVNEMLRGRSAVSATR